MPNIVHVFFLLSSRLIQRETFCAVMSRQATFLYKQVIFLLCDALMHPHKSVFPCVDLIISEKLLSFNQSQCKCRPLINLNLKIYTHIKKMHTHIRQLLNNKNLLKAGEREKHHAFFYNKKLVCCNMCFVTCEMLSLHSALK